MANQIDVANLALLNLGEAPDITSLNPPDNTKYARHAATFWPVMLDKVLSDADWSFARKTIALSAVSVTLPDAWDYAYSIPTDMVMPRMLQEDGCTDPNYGIPYEIADGVLYCSCDEVNLRYTYRNNNVGTWPNGFVLAAAAYLSQLLAAPVTKNPQVTQAMAQLYAQQLGQAMVLDTARTVNPVTYESPSIAARWA